VGGKVKKPGTENTVCKKGWLKGGGRGKDDGKCNMGRNNRFLKRDVSQGERGKGTGAQKKRRKEI